MDGTTAGLVNGQVTCSAENSAPGNSAFENSAPGSASENSAIEAARVRFRQFFEALRGRFLEREDTIEQIALALLAKEHVLLTGPPGTAKSALARAVLQNVVDRDSGLPSLFARQFTESTVQTDLIGPLDFKTLMGSGRSEHFTDEGMLGAVHAFLDEVLDGRDMLLRTTLNVLQEREFKQGTKTTTGAIECALMTSNRYLFEVLEQSRETLLAFVDRIAFVSFVPKGFADPNNLVAVLNGQLGPKAQAPLPKLTIQDIDQLQELVNYVRVSDPLVRELVLLLGRLESELVAATRADPRFVPTRYLSTRTAVRTARILRAAVVYDWIMSEPTRPLSVRVGDFRRLRLTLLLGGPSAAATATALQHEVDPRERRQLSICQTESQLFELVLAGITEQPIPAVVEAPSLPTLAEVRGMPLDARVRACQELARHADGGGLEAMAAQQRLHAVIELLTHELLSQSLRAGISEPQQGQTLDTLLQLADLLDGTHATTRHFAPLLRTRALELLEATASAVPTTSLELMRTVRGGVFEFDMAAMYASERVQLFTSRLELRTRLLAGGATRRANSEEIWRDSAARLLTEIVKLWELAVDGFLAVVKSGATPRIETLLESIRVPLTEMNTCGRAFVELGHDPSCVAARVLATKLMPYIAAALAAEAPRTRGAVAAVIESLLDRLEGVDALYVVSSSALIDWAARALIEVDEAVPPPKADEVPLGFEGYREFRQRQATSSLCHALVAAVTHIAQYAPELRAKHSPSLALVQAQLAELPWPIIQRVSDADEQRIRSTLAYLERWWGELASEARTPQAQLALIIDSRFYELIERESVLVRFTLEAELLGALFPSCLESSRAIVAEVGAFRDQVQTRVHALMHVQALAHKGVVNAAFVASVHAAKDQAR